MIKSRIAMAGALLAVAGSAYADFTVTPTVVSDYDFRGVTQTLEDPAFQLGLNYNHESGFYAGVWGSNVDFGPGKPNVEVDLFTGFSGGDAAETVGYDVGVIYYAYPSASSIDSIEIYGGLSKGWLSGKLWYSPNIASTGDSGWYIEGNATVPLPHNFSLLGHAGYTWGDASWSGPLKDVDYSLGVGYTAGNFSLSVKWVDGDGALKGRNQVVGSISTTLPWKAE
ncbi:MAG: TorF family putative porin [Steroidobacteraceae bacterium]